MRWTRSLVLPGQPAAHVLPCGGLPGCPSSTTSAGAASVSASAAASPAGSSRRSGATMDESRERFDEASAMIMRALRTGFMEGDGPFYRQPRTEIRPRPARAFDGRVYAVASSVDSVVSAARLDARMVMFADRPWPIRML